MYNLPRKTLRSEPKSLATMHTYLHSLHQNPDSTYPPLFLLPGVDGEIVGLHLLAQTLSYSGPRFAVTPRGSQDRANPLSHIEACAAHVETILAQQSLSQPIALIGWSMGGLIAHELAQQLRAQHQPAISIALDTRSMFQTSSLSPTPPLSLSDAAKNHRAGLELFAQWLCAQGIPDSHWAERPQQQQQSYLLSHGALHTSYTFLQLRQRLHLLKANLMAIERYRPTQTQDTCFVLRAGPYTERKVSWKNAVPYTEILNVPGTHQELLRPPYVQTLALPLDHILQRWLSRSIHPTNTGKL